MAKTFWCEHAHLIETLEYILKSTGKIVLLLRKTETILLQAIFFQKQRFQTSEFCQLFGLLLQRLLSY